MIKNLSNEIKKLIAVLSKREQEIIIKRFGLFGKQKETLDSTGKIYNITRERVRQIQDHSVSILANKHILNSNKLNKYFQFINKKIEELGGFAKEETVINNLKQKKENKNYLNFLFILNKDIIFLKETNDFYSRCVLSFKKNDISKIEKAVNMLVSSISLNDIYTHNDLIKNFQNKLKSLFGSEIKIDAVSLKSWMEISKFLNKNIFEEWGLVSSPHTSPKGIKDYAFLVMRRHGSPMHFKEVSEVIEKNFKKKAHIQTVHNELIKDERFVLVGRGLYALKDWGYIPGAVKDVIRAILINSGKISKEELIKRILKERYVKETTIAINLQNRNLFKKFQDGDYGLIS